MIETAAILAGGRATRLGPLTTTIPKALVEVGGKPFLDRQLTLLRSKGIRRVVLCLGHLGEQVERLVEDGARWDLSVAYSYDGTPLLGTAGALDKARRHLGESFWVFYGDSYLDFDHQAVVDYFIRKGAGKLGLMTVFANHNQWDTSNVIFRDGRLLRYDKRVQTPEMQHIDYGAALLRAGALDLIAEYPYDLADLYRLLVEAGLMLGFEVSERFYEIGSPSGIEEASRYFAGLDGARESPKD